MSVSKAVQLSVVFFMVGCANVATQSDSAQCEFPTNATVTSLDEPSATPYTGALSAFVSKCASPEQIAVTCDGNVMQITQRGYTETWTMPDANTVDLDVVDPLGASTTSHLHVVSQ